MEDDDFEDRYVYRNHKMCIHQMPPKWCATCREKEQKTLQVQQDRDLLNLLNTEKWSL